METIGDLIRRFCVEKLANILWQNVACSHSNRALLDWLTAEAFVKQNPYAIEDVLQMFLHRMGIFHTHSRESPIGAVPGNNTSYEVLERLCGRTVWNELYQPLRTSLLIPIKEPHYTRILHD